MAVRLYTKIRNKEIVFRSKVGVNFFMYLSDIVANQSIALVEEKKKEEQRKKSNSRQAKIFRLAGVLCIAAAAGCLFYFSYTSKLEAESEAEMKRLQEMQNMTGQYIEDEAYSEETAKQNQLAIEKEQEKLEPKEETKKPEIDVSKLTVLPEYEKLYRENPDLIGWITIDDTPINYPVLQSDEEDGQFYLTHSFSKKKDKNGSLFLDQRNDFVNRDTNLIIYGHNMRSGAMFGTLKQYLDKDYLAAHKKISFDTIYEHGTYEVIGAFLSEVSYEDEYTFRYYNFLNAANEKEFEAFSVNVMQLDALDQGNLDAEYGDELLTLSTCNSYTEDGRMFIIAKKIKDK